jgi:diguanylate cyclase (GGDEF)-like protein
MMIIVIILYLVLVIFCSKRMIMQFEQGLSQSLLDLEKDSQNLVYKRETIAKEKQRIKEDVLKIFTLYEITKDITKKLHLQEAFEIFLEKLKEHIDCSSCELILPTVEFKVSQENSFVFELHSEKKIIGYLVVRGLLAKDQEKFIILAQQFALTLRRIQLYEEVERTALTDSLTEVYNRRYLMQRLAEEAQRANKKKIKMSILMIDVDYFKKINDEFGHLAGDQVLVDIAQIIKDNTREIDIVGRYGGEEFCIVLPDTDKDGAKLAAERIRAAVASEPLKAYDANLKVTVSIGMAIFPKDGLHSAQLIDHADQALYKAKDHGRNRVESYN